MKIDGYDGWAGPFPFELGDILLTNEPGDLAIILGANYAYVHLWFLNGMKSDILGSDMHRMDARIELVIDEFKKVGTIDPKMLLLLKE